MIQKAASYKTSDNSVFATLEQAQKHELLRLIPMAEELANGREEILAGVMANKDAIVEVLSLKESSRPKTRKPRKATTQPATK